MKNPLLMRCGLLVLLRVVWLFPVIALRLQGVDPFSDKVLDVSQEQRSATVFGCLSL